MIIVLRKSDASHNGKLLEKKKEVIKEFSKQHGYLNSP